MAETIRDVTVRISLKQIEAALKVPNFQPILYGIEKVREANEKAGASFKGLGAEAAAAIQQIPKAIRLIPAAMKPVENAGDALQNAGLRSAEAFKRAGEGAFVLARGAAFMFTSTDEGFQRMLKNVSAVQGGFDLFKGSITTVVALTHATKALTVATGALSVTAAIAAVSMTALRTAAIVALTVFGAVASAFSGFGLIVVGVAAAVGGLGLAWRHFSAEVKTAGEDEAKVLGGMHTRGLSYERQLQRHIADLKTQTAGQQAYAGVLDLVKRGEESVLHAVEQQIDKRRKLYAEEQDRKRSALERFAAASPEERREARRIEEKRRAAAS